MNTRLTLSAVVIALCFPLCLGVGAQGSDDLESLLADLDADIAVAKETNAVQGTAGQPEQAAATQPKAEPTPEDQLLNGLSEPAPDAAIEVVEDETVRTPGAEPTPEDQLLDGLLGETEATVPEAAPETEMAVVEEAAPAATDEVEAVEEIAEVASNEAPAEAVEVEVAETPQSEEAVEVDDLFAEESAPATNVEAPVEDVEETVVVEPTAPVAQEPALEDADLDELLGEAPAEDAVGQPAPEPEADELLQLIEDQPAVGEEAVQPTAEEALAEPEEAVAQPEEEEAIAVGEKPSETEEVVAAGAAPAQPAVAGIGQPAEAAAEPIVLKLEGVAPDSLQAARILEDQEKVRRQAEEKEGMELLEVGFKSLEAGEFDKAEKSFAQALDKIPARRANQQDIARGRWGHAEADYRLARQIYGTEGGNLDEALRLCDSALKYQPDHKGVERLRAKIIRKQEAILKRSGRPIPYDQTETYVKREESVDRLFKEGRELYKLREYKQAEMKFSQILAKDEFNVDAMRFLKKIEEERYKIATTDRAATVEEAIRKVRDTWNPPLRTEFSVPETRPTGQGPGVTKPEKQLRNKMAQIMIPLIEFRQANIADVVDFLVEASIAGDPDGNGVNIVLKLNSSGGASAPAGSAPAADLGGGDDWGDAGGGDDWAAFDETPADVGGDIGGGSGGGSSSIPKITLNLRRISLLDAIDLITDVAGLKYRIDNNVVIITPTDMPTSRVITEMYPVQPTILDTIFEKSEDTSGGGGGGGGDFIAMGENRTTTRSRTADEVKKFFVDMGVPFPAGTSIQYNRSISQLIVRNTAENLEIFERILGQLNVIPTQVEIEARFVEIMQSDLQELGLEWILTDNWQIADKPTTGMPGGNERVQVDKDSNGFTKGLRFFGYDGTTGAVQPGSPITRGTSAVMGGIMSISSILTNPQLTAIIHALDQKGNVDLLSAPRVTTQSGVNATIQVVNEIIYPTEFDSEVQTLSGGTDTSDRNIVVVTPGSFETRETGVILNVTPTVAQDGYAIKLDLVPEVAELVDWIQYGSVIQDYAYNIPQPVFSSRNVTTSLVVYDGATVVMGGLIREDMVSYEDKVPLLGDIPLLGYLFRSKGQQSQKRNLLIFVTARLVDPEGKPLQRRAAMAEAAKGAAEEASN